MSFLVVYSTEINVLDVGLFCTFENICLRRVIVLGDFYKHVPCKERKGGMYGMYKTSNDSINN